MIGRKLGPYTIEGELGSGAMGTVYRATGPQGTVALKIVHMHLLAVPGFDKRFRREAEIGTSVVHRNVVRTLGVGAATIDGAQRHFLVMEHVEGQTLRDLLSELGRAPEELCRHIGREIALGLQAIHKIGAIHRDLKPENVLITPDHQIKIMDLGVARQVDEAARLSQTGGFTGSVLYAAPEQFRGEALDARADFYALGLILYELATGRHPSRGPDFASIMRLRLNDRPEPAGRVNPQLSAEFEEILNGLLAIDRSERLDFLPERDSAWWRDRAKSIRAAASRPLRRIRIPRDTALYGRGGEMARLRALFERVKEGNGQVVLIGGEAGIGKTRLVDEFVGQLNEDVHFLCGAYAPGGAATAAGAFSAAYREQIGDGGSARYLRETPLLVAAFDALLRGDAPPKGSEPLTQDSMQTAFVHATRALAAERPTIILIDDLQFAPEHGRALFSALALAVPGHRVLLLGAARPDLAENWRVAIERLPHATWIPLSRLGPKDLVRLLENSFGSTLLAGDLAGRIALKSDGNPFFVFEIIRGLREGQFIAKARDGAWVRSRAIEKIQIPSSVLDLIHARIADLEEHDRDLLDIAACCGFEFDPLLVAGAAGVEKIPALKRLARIEAKHRLVRSAGDVFLFDHHQVQEALYGRLPPPLAREYHAALAEALEARGPVAADGPGTVALAEHFLKAGRGERALPYLDRALDHLVEGHLNEQALALAGRALGTPDLVAGERRVALLLREADLLDLLGWRDRQRSALDEASRLAERHAGAALRAKARLSLGWLLYCTWEQEAAERVLLEAIDLARAAGDREAEARANGSLGHVLAARGRVDEARSRYGRQLALAREGADRKGEATATGHLGALLRGTGRFEEALGHFERQLVLAREIGDRRGEAVALGNLGATLLSLGRCEEARACSESYLALSREIGDRRAEAVAVGNLGAVLLSLGRYREALEHSDRHLSLAREIGYRRGEAVAIGNIGVVSAALGRWEEARSRFEQCLALAREIGDRRSEGYALSGLADVAEAGSDAAAAGRLHGEALALRRELRAHGAVADVLVGLGRAKAAQGDPEGAVACIEEALELGRAVGSPNAIVLAAIERARLPGGDPHAARNAIAEHGRRLDHAVRMRASFELWRLTGDDSQLQEAYRLIQEARVHAPDADHDSMIDNVPLHRAILQAWAGRARDSGTERAAATGSRLSEPPP